MVDLSGAKTVAASNWRIILFGVFFIITIVLTGFELNKGDCIPKGDKTGWKGIAISQWVFTLLTIFAAYLVWG